MSETVYLIDSMSLIFQVFHAIPSMTGPRGQPTNAVFGFTRDLQAILRDKKPAYLVCALDSSGPGLRNEVYAEYKANRSAMPDDLVPQVPMILQVLDGYRIQHLEHAGWEADDVIATLTRQAVERGLEVRIVTSDKDVRQLIGPRVQMYNARKNLFLDEAHLQKEWGIRPDQVVDFQALVGDSVDNIPGVPLVGPKKAQALLEKFGTLEGVLAHADEAPGAKLRQNLKEFAEQARVCKQLAELNSALPIEFDWERARVQEPDRVRLLEVFNELGFRRLAEEMKAVAPARPAATGGMLPFAEAERKWEVIDTPEGLAKLVQALRKQKRICLDLETTSGQAMQAEIVGWSLCWEPGQAFYVPVKGPAGQKRLDGSAVIAAFKPMLEEPGVEVVNENVKHELIVLLRGGVRVRSIGMDPMVGDYLLDAGARTHELEKLGERYLGQRMTTLEELTGKGSAGQAESRKAEVGNQNETPPVGGMFGDSPEEGAGGDAPSPQTSSEGRGGRASKGKPLDEIDVARVAEYAAERVDITLAVAERVGEELTKAGLRDLYWDLERPLIPVLALMEHTGIRVDVKELAGQSKEITERLDRIIEGIHKEAGRTFNIDSPIQLRTVLFDELKLPVIKRTKTGPSTNQEVLERLAEVHPLPRLITEHRHLSKLKGTYLDSLPLLVNAKTGRIHASFNQVVAATGRLSAHDPNLQNIPIRTPEGERVRKAFVPGATGWKLVCADYSQIELRLLAHYSGDTELTAAFQKGEDIHTAVASEIFGVPDSAVSSEMRRIAKAVNFGVIYGQSPFGLAAALSIGQAEAAAFIENYFARYSGVDRFLTQLLQECAESGYARTILGRRREITGIRDGRGRQRNLPERTAINTVFQGSAADLIKRAMIRIAERLEKEGHSARMLLQIHDELVFESPAAKVGSLVEIVRSEMEGALELKVPLVVDVSAGENWLETEDV